jgi:hypothetical protein
LAGSSKHLKNKYLQTPEAKSSIFFWPMTSFRNLKLIIKFSTNHFLFSDMKTNFNNQLLLQLTILKVKYIFTTTVKQLGKSNKEFLKKLIL